MTTVTNGAYGLDYNVVIEMENERNQERVAMASLHNLQYIPTKNGGYVPRKIVGSMSDMEVFDRAYGVKDNVLLVGETGTGKTHAVRHWCYDNRKAYIRVNLNEATTVEDLVGQWTPAKGGGFEWKDGVLTRFLRYGGVFVCDEINAANAGILFVLHSVLDDERRIVLVQKDGEIVHAHPDFWFIATMNPDYEGTKPLNSALKDRFKVVLEYDYDEKIEKKIVSNDTIRAVSENLRELYRKGEIMTPVSTRMMLQYCSNCDVYGDELALKIFLNKFSKEEAKAIASAVEVLKPSKAKGGSQ